MPKYSPLHQHAEQFIREYSDLCEALVFRSKELSAYMENVLALRSSLVRLLLAYRRAIKEFATRNVCDEKRLIKSVSNILRWRKGLRGYISQILRRCSKRAWKLEQIFGANGFFEVETIDEDFFNFLRLHRTDVSAAAQVRDKLKALTLHYASLTSTVEAVNFLKDLASYLENLL